MREFARLRISAARRNGAVAFARATIGLFIDLVGSATRQRVGTWRERRDSVASRRADAQSGEIAHLVSEAIAKSAWIESE